MSRVAESIPLMSHIIRLSSADNVAIAAEGLAVGEKVDVDGRLITIREPISACHKVAVAPIGRGEKVLKFGAPIGSATGDIAPGEHVHSHNLMSDYFPT